MARQLRIQYQGAIYHLMSRGDRREAIFYDDAMRSTLPLESGSESRSTKARTGESVVNRLALDPRWRRVEAARLES
jgi:hypothetical protein